MVRLVALGVASAVAVAAAGAAQRQLAVGLEQVAVDAAAESVRPRPAAETLYWLCSWQPPCPLQSPEYPKVWGRGFVVFAVAAAAVAVFVVAAAVAAVVVAVAAAAFVAVVAASVAVAPLPAASGSSASQWASADGDDTAPTAGSS